MRRRVVLDAAPATIVRRDESEEKDAARTGVGSIVPIVSKIWEGEDEDEVEMSRGRIAMSPHRIIRQSVRVSATMVRLMIWGRLRSPEKGNIPSAN